MESMSQHISLQSLTSSFIYNHTHLTYSFRAADNHIGFTIIQSLNGKCRLTAKYYDKSKHLIAKHI